MNAAFDVLLEHLDEAQEAGLATFLFEAKAAMEGAAALVEAVQQGCAALFETRAAEELHIIEHLMQLKDDLDEVVELIEAQRSEPKEDEGEEDDVDDE